MRIYEMPGILQGWTRVLIIEGEKHRAQLFVVLQYIIVKLANRGRCMYIHVYVYMRVCV